jgi:hypothetical protein
MHLVYPLVEQRGNERTLPDRSPARMIEMMEVEFAGA